MLMCQMQIIVEQMMLTVSRFSVCMVVFRHQQMVVALLKLSTVFQFRCRTQRWKAR